MKVREILQDSMLIVGCVVGVSFVTGKEAQVFVGNAKSILIFAVVFGAITLLVRLFCEKYRLQSTQQFVHFAFKKWGYVVYFALLGCYFVCIVTTLATVESCFGELLGKLPFPLFSATIAVASALLLNGEAQSFKVVSTLALILAFVTFLLCSNDDVTPNNANATPIYAILYGLFSLTMVLPVCCAKEKRSKTHHVLCVLIATLAVTLLLLWVDGIADFSQKLPIGGKLVGWGKACLCLTICLCGVCGVIANARPICDGLCDIVTDKHLLRFVVLGLAWAFSCFGLDILLKYGYLFVALVGIVIVARCVLNKAISQEMVD